jgi:hypothetical protein
MHLIERRSSARVSFGEATKSSAEVALFTRLYVTTRRIHD